MIGKESWIRASPVLLNLEQSLFLDGVRFAVQTADLAFNRLKVTLRTLALQREGDNEHLIVSAVHDAWSVVDSLNRLRGLMIKPPRFGGERPSEVQLFINETEHLRQLRNQVQHLEGKLQKIAADSDSVWGKISWVSWVGEGEQRRGFTCALLAGTLRPDNPGVVTFPASIPADMETEEVALHAAGREVRLDLAMDATADLVEWLEGLLDWHFRPLEGEVPNTLPDFITVAELNLEELEKLHRGES